MPIFVVHRGTWKPLPDYPTCYFIDFEFFWAQVAIWFLLAKIEYIMLDDITLYDPQVSGLAAWHGFWKEVAIATSLHAMRNLYNLMPRWSCPSLQPDGCPVCVARLLTRGAC